MTNHITPFSFESHEVRVVDDGGEPWFVLRDVIEALGRKGTRTNEARSSIEQGLGDGYVKTVPLQTSGGVQNVILINEPAVTFLVARSNTEVGRKLNRWIHAEVIPSIRKTGSYTALDKDHPGPTALEMIPVAMAAAQAFGFTGNQAALSANAAVKAITGVPVLELMGHTHLPAPVQEITHTPTQIGQMLTPAKSGSAVNIALCDLGLQNREGNRWVPTDKAEGLCEILDTGKRYSNGAPVKQVKWYGRVIDLLQEQPEDVA
jgi:prophage antirepressor-like protein